MIILKHVEYKINSLAELESLLSHLAETTSKMQGVTLNDIYFPRGKEEFVLVLDCITEEHYLNWRKVCLPPPNARDWYEVFLTREEHFGN